MPEWPRERADRVPEDRGARWEDTTTSVRRLISLFSRSSGLVDQIFFQWLTRGRFPSGGGATGTAVKGPSQI